MRGSLSLSIELAKSTTGDGFYIWNRETGAMPNIALFIILTFNLADNALSKTKDTKSFVPLLRAAFRSRAAYLAVFRSMISMRRPSFASICPSW